MKCIEAQQLVKPYLEKQLSDRQLEQFLDHVESCPECYDELEIYFFIYETLGESGRNQDTEEYDFKGKLKHDMKNSRRYLHLRKAYRLFRFAIVLLAEVLLIFTVITGIEMRGEEGSKGTTVYRVIYGRHGRVEPVADSETEPQTEPRTEPRTERTEPQAEPRNELRTEPQTEPQMETLSGQTERSGKKAADKTPDENSGWEQTKHE